MRKHNAAIVCMITFVIAGVVCTPLVLYWLHEQQFRVAQSVVATHGGNLSFDLVDGNYMLQLNNTSDDEVIRMIDTLRALPTGSTLVGPGESRHFWITISDSSITDEGLAKLCDLDVTFLKLSNCPQVTESYRSSISRIFDY